MKKTIKKALILVTGLLLFASCGSETDVPVAEDTEITVYTSSGYAPYEIVTTEGELDGFDIVLMNYMAEDLGYTINWVDVSFDSIVPSVMNGMADMAIAGMSPSPERLESVDFSINYYDTDEGLVNVIVSDDTELDLTNLEGKVIGTQLGTVQNTLLNEYAEKLGYTVKEYDAYATLKLEVENGRIDAFICEDSITDKLLADTDLSTFVFDKKSANDTSGNAICFEKGSEYKEIFDAEIVKLQDNGYIEQLAAEWFGSSAE